MNICMMTFAHFSQWHNVTIPYNRKYKIGTERLSYQDWDNSCLIWLAGAPASHRPSEHRAALSDGWAECRKYGGGCWWQHYNIHNHYHHNLLSTHHLPGALQNYSCIYEVGIVIPTLNRKRSQGIHLRLHNLYSSPASFRSSIALFCRKLLRS